MTDHRTLETERDRPSPSHDPFGGDASSPEPEVDPARRHPTGSQTGQWIAVGVGATVLAVAGVFGVSALASHTKSAATVATAGASGGGAGFAGGPARGGLLGTVTSINGTSLVMSTVSGTTETVVTTPATVFTKTVAASLADVKAGDHVVVIGAGTSGVAARSIADSGSNTMSAIGIGPAPPGGPGGPPGGTAPAPISGTVATVGNASLTITDASGASVTVITSSSTTVANVQTTSLSDLSVGEQVQVRGSTSNGMVTATAVAVGSGFGPGGQGAPPGQGALGGPPGQAPTPGG